MPAIDKRPLKVFLCHAHADRDPVRGLYSRLTQDGVDAWLDKAKLLPGQDWELEIRKAVREADVVVVCLSKQFNQAGFRQKEVRLALDTAMEKPEGEIFIIPARLEECDNLESLRKWHWVDLFEEDGYEMLIRALRARADKVGVTLQTRRRVTKPRDPKTSDLLSRIPPKNVGVGGLVSGSVISVGNGNNIRLNNQEASRPLINLQPLPVEEIANPLYLLLGSLDDEQSEEEIYVDQVKPTIKQYDLSEIHCKIKEQGVVFEEISKKEIQIANRQGHEVVKGSEQGQSYLTKPRTSFIYLCSLRNIGKEAAINILIDMIAPRNSSRWSRTISLLSGEKVNLRLLIDVHTNKIEKILGKYILSIEYGDVSKRYQQEYEIEIEHKENGVVFKIGLDANQPEMNNTK